MKKYKFSYFLDTSYSWRAQIPCPTLTAFLTWDSLYPRFTPSIVILVPPSIGPVSGDTWIDKHYLLIVNCKLLIYHLIIFKSPFLTIAWIHWKQVIHYMFTLSISVTYTYELWLRTVCWEWVTCGTVFTAGATPATSVLLPQPTNTDTDTTIWTHHITLVCSHWNKTVSVH